MAGTLNHGTPAPRVGILYGGVCWQREPWKNAIDDYELVHVTKLAKRVVNHRRLELSGFDIFIVPWAPDQRLLKENARELQRFVNSGGVLIAFGEFDENWIPYTFWRSGLANEIRIEDPQHPFFSKLTEKDLSEWNDSAHGWFAGMPAKAKVLLSGKFPDGEWRPVAFVDQLTFRGTIIAQTVDADFHTYNGMPEALAFLRNILGWAVDEYYDKERRSGYRLRRRMLRRVQLFGWLSFGFVELMMGAFVTVAGMYAISLIWGAQ